ncbi:6-bladed beta-propeller [Pedobacter sp. PLR]|uniref:6-bladed beta-propeller n=1 Tax=Pedobacter sp. PLR TaxID=2994465 RepID=UPI002246E0BF|nr:6-bladed beta-propeller [Pedobacter sp. PLR]MCX2451417.1 6-bladed beta-propeller [Pedobacter sp. PLR]
MKLSLNLKTALCTFFIYVSFYSPIIAQSSKIDSSAMVTLRLDPGSARGAAVSQVFEEVSFIPLETTKESLFGSISQLEVTEKCFIVYDYDTKSILIFSKAGKFKAKINSSNIKDEKGKEAQSFWGFSLKQENHEDFIQINSGKYSIYFDLNGKLAKKVQSKDDKPDNGLKFADKTQIVEGYLDKKDKDSIYYQVGLVKDSNEVAKYLPYKADRFKNDQFYSGGNPFYDSGIADELFFLNYYEYNIFKVTPKKMLLAYRIIFPAINSLPADFAANPVYKNKRQEYFEKYPKAFYAISNTYKIGDQLFLKMHNWDHSKENKNALIYNLKTTALISVNGIEPDSSSFFLPVTDLGFYYDFSNRGFLKYDKKYFYTSYSSLAMFAFKEQSADKKPKYNALMSNYFKTENRKSNPVIIQLKPKQD